MKVLIITHSRDNDSVERVADAVRARGGQPFRFDTDRFPVERRLSVEYDAQGTRWWLETEEGTVDARTLDAVWYRRYAAGGGLPADMDAQIRDGALKEIRATLAGLLQALPCFQLDGYEKVRRTENKHLQMEAARAVGLELPDTLVTNDPARLRDFFLAHPEGIIGKLQSSFAVYDEKGREQVVFTNRIQAEDLLDAESLKYSPMTFQALVPKALELRVTVAGRKIFAAAVDSQARERSVTDWRRDGRALLDTWQPHELPAALETRIHALMDTLGLNYGALDFILTPDGRHVFLEVNPAGEFFWLDGLMEGAIADALAATLVDQAPRRESPPVLMV